ncbi:MAG TPA: N-acetyltransferase [Nostocaceae cyanobacterium]|nr:N-acetyltransferase [Nostocaceae cyanobacterium]
MQLPLHKVLKNGTKVELNYIHPQEEEVVRALLNQIIIAGKSYPQIHPLSKTEFASYWLAKDAFVVRMADQSSASQTQEVLGAFFLKPNFPGRCCHIANAGFIVQPEWQGQGIGRLMGESMLLIAAELGYQAVMFNLVFDTNIASINLWRSLGFTTIGRIPAAVKLEDGEMIDALMMYKGIGNR